MSGGAVGGAPAIGDHGPDELARIFSVEEFEPLARARMEPSAYGYVAGWAGTGWTTRHNRAAYGRWVFRPRVLVDVSSVDTATTVLGTPIDVPILFAPTAIHRLSHPDGELATARAARALGTIGVLSTGCSLPIEDVAAVGHRRWFQLYWYTNRELTRELIERANASGFEAIVLTVDAPVPYWRETEARLPLLLPPDVTQPNLPRDPNLAYDRTLTWDSLEWLRSVSPLPILLKGVVRADDARRAAEHGVAGIIVSNHGGRQADTATPTLEALPAITEAVDGRIDVLVDGGVRRGTDVLKALALGARAVLIGRPVQWGLAVGGEAGVVRLVDLMAGELRSAMGVTGCRTIDEIGPTLLRRNPDPLAGIAPEDLAEAVHTAFPGIAGDPTGPAA